MFRVIHSLSLLVTLSSVVWLSGCGSSVENDQPAPTSVSSVDQNHADHADAGHDHGTAGQEADRNANADAFAELSTADRLLAERQKTCPVTKMALGSMGTPIKVLVGDRDVFICCEGCREKLLENADEFLATLNP